MNTIFDLMANPWGVVDDFFCGGRTLRNARARAAGKFPPMNVYVDENAILVDVELPGRTAANVELSLEPQAVVIADKPAAEEPAADGDGKVSQRAKPAWTRRLELPFRVDADKANAKFTDGILRIELPKVAEQTVRKLSIA